MNKLQLFLHPTKKTVIITTIGFILFVSIVLPLISSLTTYLIGVSDAPDTSLFFTSNELIALLEAYGTNGRKIYIIMRWTFDVIWPIVYTVFFVVLYCYFSTRRLYVLFPLIAVLFDFLENSTMTIHMAIYPRTIDWLLQLSGYITLLKWISIGTTVIVLFILVITYIIQKKALT